MIEHKYTFCKTCVDWTVVCGQCGNTTCSGGERCDKCPGAYAHHDKIIKFKADYDKWWMDIAMDKYQHDDEHPAPKWEDYDRRVD